MFILQLSPSFGMHLALLKTGKVKCDDLTDEESDQADDCALEVILREIINNQNAQIQAMRAILDAKSYPAENDCKVDVRTKASSASSTAVSAGTALVTVASSLYLMM